ncbi:MAG: hypothetical protein JF595_11690, partial [Sphingomonadales bacterium]|nr:hypothetical protein [Sphingomonadales bacterium]
MKRLHLLIGTALALTSGWALAQKAPESLLPPGFDEPAPKAPPRAEPAQTPGAAPRGQSGTGGNSASSSVPVVQPLPGAAPPPAPSADAMAAASKLPPVEVLEKMSPEELEEALNLKPKFDIPPAARRSMERIGVLD